MFSVDESQVPYNPASFDSYQILIPFIVIHAILSTIGVVSCIVRHTLNQKKVVQKTVLALGTTLSLLNLAIVLIRLGMFLSKYGFVWRVFYAITQTLMLEIFCITQVYLLFVWVELYYVNKAQGYEHTAKRFEKLRKAFCIATAIWILIGIFVPSTVSTVFQGNTEYLGQIIALSAVAICPLGMTFAGLFFWKKLLGTIKDCLARGSPSAIVFVRLTKQCLVAVIAFVLLLAHIYINYNHVDTPYIGSYIFLLQASQIILTSSIVYYFSPLRTAFNRHIGLQSSTSFPPVSPANSTGVNASSSSDGEVHNSTAAGSSISSTTSGTGNYHNNNNIEMKEVVIPTYEYDNNHDPNVLEDVPL